jgi:hypothetical protein
MDEITQKFGDKIKQFNINGLEGRMLELPAKYTAKNRNNFLLIQGMHGSIERYVGLIEYLSNYGSVTVVDAPGFGGMQSFYSIGLDASLNRYGDYLATLIKWRFKKKHYILVSYSISFVFITRMLQKYPSMKSQISRVIALGAFADSSDFHEVWYKQDAIKVASAIASYRTGAMIIRATLLSTPMLKLIYRFNLKNNHLSKIERREMADIEIYLWRLNDLRTQGSTMYQIHTFKMLPIKIDIGIEMVVTSHDRWIDSDSARKNLGQIYHNINVHHSSTRMHGITIIDNEADVARFVPESFATMLEAI